MAFSRYQWKLPELEHLITVMEFVHDTVSSSMLFWSTVVDTYNATRPKGVRERSNTRITKTWQTMMLGLEEYERGDDRYSHVVLKDMVSLYPRIRAMHDKLSTTSNTFAVQSKYSCLKLGDQ